MISVVEYQARCSSLLGAMQSRALDLAVFSPGPDMLYFSGYYDSPSERPLLFLMPADGSDAFFFVPELEREHVARSTWVGSLFEWKDGTDPWSGLRECVRKLRVRRVAFDGSMRADWLLPALKALGDPFPLDANDLVRPLREVKSVTEVGLLRKAGEIAVNAFGKILPQLEAGVTERKVAQILETEMLAEGADSPAFPTIVAAGANASVPHHLPTTKVLKSGEPVVIDFGAQFQHYNSDMTRTLFVGHPDNEFQTAYNAVKVAQAAGFERARAGSEARAVDNAARESLRMNGLAEYFIHRTGHGIGLQVHEHPYINFSNPEKLLPGVCFSIEPGVYFGGKWGIRIEDIVTVTDKEMEILTPFDRELLRL